MSKLALGRTAVSRSQRMTRRQRLEALYARVPDVGCKGLCHEACGPISCSAYEQERMESTAKHALGFDGNLTCNMLGPMGRCIVYPQRPMICRLYGAVERMRCQHGCKPARWLTDVEAFELLAEAEGLR